MSLRSQTLIALVVLAAGHTAAKEVCNNTEATFKHLNATDSYVIPGLSSPGQPAETWTVSTGIQMTSDNQNVQQSWSIDTQPAINIISEDLPWTGCFVVFGGLPGRTNLEGYDDDGDCTSLFSKSCVDALTNDIKQQALSMSGENGTDFDCNSFSNISPSECSGWKGGPTVDFIVSANLGAPRGSYAVNNTDCIHSRGSGSAFNNSLLSVGASAPKG